MALLTGPNRTLFSAVCQEDSCIVWVELKILPLRPPGDSATRFVLCVVSVQTNNLVSCSSSADVIGVPATCLGFASGNLFP